VRNYNSPIICNSCYFKDDEGYCSIEVNQSFIDDAGHCSEFELDEEAYCTTAHCAVGALVIALVGASMWVLFG
jgi:hypothetical protein